MSSIRRLAVLICVAALVAACGKSASPGGSDAPLAFAPADTPYAYANLEPMPADVLAAQSKHMHAFWPLLFEQYDAMLNDAELGARPHKILSAVLDELRPRDSLDKMAGGLTPVIDTEVGLEDLEKSLARLEGRQVFGKVIVNF